MANNIDILYDLSQDLILNDAVNPLKTLALYHVIPEFFKPKLLEMYSLHSNHYLENADRFCEMELEVVKEVDQYIGISIKRDICKVVYFVGTQINIFLSKNKHNFTHIILRNLVFTSQGTINLKETIFKILHSENLSNKVKFEIACLYFVGMQLIYKYYKLLPKEVIYDYLEELPVVVEYIPVYFWICRFTDEAIKIKYSGMQVFGLANEEIEISNDQIEHSTEYLFSLAINTFNDMAVQYLWDNFISDLTDRYKTLDFIFFMVSLSVKSVKFNNVITYLILSMSIEEMTAISQKYGAKVIKYFLHQLRWQSSFRKVFKIFHNLLDEKAYIDTLELVVSIICSDIIVKTDSFALEEVLTKMPKSVKVKIISHYDDLFYTMLQNLYNKKHLESCLLLLEIGGPLNIKNVFSTNLGLVLFDKPALSVKFDFIDDILDYSLNSIGSIKELKITFYRKRAHSICNVFILQRQSERLKLFVNWCSSYVSKEEIMLHKLNIL